MSADWPRAPLGELLTLREPDVEVRPDQEYHFAGVYCFGKGAFVGQKRMGREFAYQRLTRLRAGDFVYPKLMAWEGAYALVPSNCDGLVVSTEFPVFSLDTTRLVPEFLGGYFRRSAIWPELGGKSTGTNVRRQRLNPADFLAYRFPLPPVAEQRRIMVRVDAIASRVAEARRLRDEAEVETAIWGASSKARFFDELERCHPLQPLSELVTVRGGGTPSKANPLLWQGTLPWVSPKDMKESEIRDATDHISEEALAESPAKPLNPGAVLIVVRGMILARTVPVAVLRVRATINQDLKALVPKETVDSEYLREALTARTRELLGRVEKSSHDTRKLETDRLLSLSLPVPESQDEQRRIVAHLDALHAKLDAVRSEQAATAAELDALLPSVLNRAFAGEL